MNVLVKVQIGQRDSFHLQELLRLQGRTLRDENSCSGFTSVNRNDQGRVDLYLFDVSSSLEELHTRLLKVTQGDIEFQAQNDSTPEWRQVKHAGQIADILLTEYPDDNLRYENLFQHVLHYSINAMGKGYDEEKSICQNWCKRVFGQPSV